MERSKAAPMEFEYDFDRFKRAEVAKAAEGEMEISEAETAEMEITEMETKEAKEEIKEAERVIKMKKGVMINQAAEGPKPNQEDRAVSASKSHIVSASKMTPVSASKSFMTLVSIYIILVLIWTVHSDLNKMAHQQSLGLTANTESLQKIHSCSHSYSINKCHPSERVPALQQQCQEWELCMQIDPKKVERLKLVAEAAGQLINRFVEQLSFKAMAFTTVITFLFLFLK
jgi:hypothetical protein